MQLKPMLKLSVRELEIKDIQLTVDYWLLSTPEYLVSLGVDLSKNLLEFILNLIKQNYGLIYFRRDQLFTI